MLTDPAMLNNILTTALDLVMTLGMGIVDAIPGLIDAVVALIIGLVDFILDPKNQVKVSSAALELVIALAGGLISALPQLWKASGELIATIVDNFRETDWGQLGTDLVSGFKNGIENAWANLKKWFTGLFGDLTEIAKKILGIASPSKVFKKFGKFVDEGLAIGIEENANIAYSAVDDLSSGVVDSFDAPKYIGSVKTTPLNAATDASNKEVARLLTQVVDLLESGRAKMDIGNTRDLRRALASG
jgi:hypothetical protein